jgi:uncharacterized membrane protein SpoIIM required for sporulation
MRQRLFEQTYRQEWRQFEQKLSQLEGKNSNNAAKADLANFAGDYRRLCHLLSLSRERQYSSQLVDQLNGLVLRGHQQLYQRKTSLLTNIISFIVMEFPALIRQEWKFCTAACVLFYLPTFILFAFVCLYPELIFSVIPAQFVDQLEQMYDPAAEHIGRERDASSDIQMFGNYIQNNISIGFRTFAGGILYGLGTLFFLIYNGIFFGAIAGHIVNIAYQETFFPFVIGHGAFELTAITFAGAAGLRMGYALIAPGRQTRLQALRSAAAIAIKIIYGVILMLLIAAFIEAFWSSRASLPPTVKYIVGTLFWLLVLGYFIWGGRRHRA